MSRYSIDLSKLHKACSHVLTYDDATGRYTLNSSCTLKDSKGKPKTVRRTFDLTDLVAKLYKKITETMPSTIAGGDEDVVSGWLSNALKRAVRVAKSVGQNQALRTIVPEVAPFVPGGAAALSIATKAARVLEKAREGHEESIDKIRLVVQRAREGNVKAQQTLDMLKQMAMMLATKEGEKVSGWLYNKPYRGPIQALSVDTSNPFTVARHLYVKGMKGESKEAYDVDEAVKRWLD